jgi:hypothetical protein
MLPKDMRSAVVMSSMRSKLKYVCNLSSFLSRYNEHADELPRNDDNSLDLRQMSVQLNYSQTDLADQRVNA